MFGWDNQLSEEENYMALDVKMTKAYFGHDPMLYEMKK